MTIMISTRHAIIFDANVTVLGNVRNEPGSAAKSADTPISPVSEAVGCGVAPALLCALFRWFGSLNYMCEVHL